MLQVKGYRVPVFFCLKVRGGKENKCFYVEGLGA